MLAERRVKRTDDLTSALLDAEIDGDRLDDEEIMGFLFLMVVAGNETTTKLPATPGTGAGLPTRGPSPSPTRRDRWVEETLRYDTSSQMLARITTEPVELHGTTIEAGELVVLLPGSANRDDALPRGRPLRPRVA